MTSVKSRVVCLFVCFSVKRASLQEAEGMLSYLGARNDTIQGRLERSSYNFPKYPQKSNYLST